MKIVPVPHGLDEFIGKSTGHRSPGLHMSEIYNDLYSDLEPKRYKRGEPMDLLRLEAGLALESFLEEGLKKRLIERPGEFTSDEGIICSPDLVIFNGHTRIGEIKLTWLSCREVPTEPTNGFPPKFSKYFSQMLSYAHIVQTPYARLMAFFVNGDYSFIKQPDGSTKPRGPQFMAWDICFTAREIAENWTMMINHAKGKGML